MTPTIPASFIANSMKRKPSPVNREVETPDMAGVVKVQSDDAFLYLRADVTGQLALVARQPYDSLALALSNSYPFGPGPELSVIRQLALREQLAAGSSLCVPFMGCSVTLGVALSDDTLRELSEFQPAGKDRMTCCEDVATIIKNDPFFTGEETTERFIQQRG